MNKFAFKDQSCACDNLSRWKMLSNNNKIRTAVNKFQSRMRIWIDNRIPETLNNICIRKKKENLNIVTKQNLFCIFLKTS